VGGDEGNKEEGKKERERRGRKRERREKRGGVGGKHERVGREKGKCSIRRKEGEIFVGTGGDAAPGEREKLISHHVEHQVAASGIDSGEGPFVQGRVVKLQQANAASPERAQIVRMEKSTIILIRGG